MTPRRFIGLLALLAVATAFYGYWGARSQPLLRSANIAVAGWPEGVAPIRLVLISDVHVSGPDMPPERLRRLVDRINALQPDLVLIAGDFLGTRKILGTEYPLASTADEIGRLRSRLGVFAVLGNHDHERGAHRVRTALTRAGVRMLDNDAVRIGPLVVGGVDDEVGGNSRPGAVVDKMRRLGGLRVMLNHSPDLFPDLPSDIPLTLSGHTHCGQIVLPLIGAPTTMSRYGDRYRCGIIREGPKTLIVTAGLGTSLLPMRIGAPPDMWLLTLRPKPDDGTAPAVRG